jgi:hypothetical protein
MLVSGRPRNGSIPAQTALSRQPRKVQGKFQAKFKRGFEMAELTISPEKVAFLIEKAREFDVKETDTDPDSGSNATDDGMVDVLEDNGRDPVQRELTGFIGALNEDEQLDLVTLTWLGRGEGGIEEWDDLRARAVEARGAYRDAPAETARYLLGEPLLGDLLADGLDAVGVDWTEGRTSADSSSESERSEDDPVRS